MVILKDAIMHLTDIASFVFREDNMEIAIHGNKKKFELIRLKLDMLFNTLKNENSNFQLPSSQLTEPKEF